MAAGQETARIPAEMPEVLYVGSSPDWFVEPFRRDFTLHALPTGDPAALEPAVAARISAVIAAGAVGKPLIDALPRLRMIANLGAGYEKIDIAAARARGILLSNTPNVTDGCVADMAFGLLLAVARQIVLGDRFVREGRWAEQSFGFVPRVHGRVLGILGLGRIGQAIARRAQGFDMAVAYHNRRPRDDVPFTYHATPAALAAASDFLIVACPGGSETFHLVDAEVLRALGPKGIIVNIARGPIIDEQALIAALGAGALGGAGLDVFEHEPQVPAALRSFDNVVLMPHRGGGTFETWHDLGELMRANLRAFFQGEPLVTPIP